MRPRSSLRGSWVDQAACKGHDMELIQHTRRQEWYARQNRYLAKLRICAICPVLEQCRAWVMSEPDDPCPFHVVAGMVPVERGRIRKQARIAS